MALDETKKRGCGCNDSCVVTEPSPSKKIIYYKLNSPYCEDYTKNCGLVGSEIDQNFFNLKEMDIARADWDTTVNEIVLTRVDGEEIRVKGLYDTIRADFKEFDFSYNPASGILSIITPEEEFEIKGFFTDDKLMMANDDTLSGDGCMSNPLGVASVARTGTYRPVKNIVDAVEGESTEITLNKLKPVKGDRFVTVENIGKFGRLYEYDGVEKIAADLKENASEWRIPSKTDWDVMLTCVEGCVCGSEKTPWHDDTRSNVDLGKSAGQRLRTLENWETYEPETTPVGYDSDYNYTTEGTDTHGFSVLPLGYGDENANSSKGYGRYSAFWTSTREDRHNDMYTKRFNYNRNTVYQASTEPTERLSLRLVKTFNGKNFDETEVINGMTYPCVLVTVPSEIKDATIHSADTDADTNLYATVWTQVNIGFNNPDYLPKTKITDDEWSGRDNYNVRYFVNDFDGQEWTKHELKEGESVVVTEEYNGVRMHEWRIVDGVLVDTIDVVKKELEGIFNEKFEEVHEKIDKEIERAQTEEKRIESKLDAEIERSTSADIDLKNDLKQETETREKEDLVLHGRIDDEIERAKAEEARLDAKIDEEIERAQTEEQRIEAKLDAEIERAKDEEARLDAKIDEEIERAKAEEARLDAKIDEEIERAKAEEARLDGRIDKEIEDRIANDIKTGDYDFDVNGGILETNGADIPDIKITFDFNFGDLPDYTPNEVTE